jgi:branched-chain amino acid aminotransferase
MILPGVTRDSVLRLSRAHASGAERLGLPDKFVVNERQVPMKEVQEAASNGSLVELFGAGVLRRLNP